MAHELRLDLDVLTPLFLRGAEPHRPELRAPSFKGLLRFWYRAADPDFPDWESALLGGAGTGSGQSGLLLRIESEPVRRRLTWAGLNVDRFSLGSGRNTRNGLIYLGFPFQMRGDDQAIAPGHRFSVRCLLPRTRAEDSPTQIRLRRAVVASWWLLAHFGGAGSRSRRGFGSLALRDWRAVRGDWPELEDLPLVASATSAADARILLERGVQTIRSWFPGSWPAEANQHPHLGKAFRFRLLEPAKAQSAWDAALADLGSRMQDFRLRRGPDYQMVKDHLLFEARQGGQPLSTAPTRTSFGLPLAFRYSSVRVGTAMFLPYDQINRTSLERHGSLLLLRLLAVGEVIHPLVVRMDGAVPGQDPPAALRRSSRPLGRPAANAMDAFFDSLSSGEGRRS